MAKRMPSLSTPAIVLLEIVWLVVPPAPNALIRIPAQPPPHVAFVMLFPDNVPVAVPDPAVLPTVMPFEPFVLFWMGSLLVMEDVSVPLLSAALMPFVLMKSELVI